MFLNEKGVAFERIEIDLVNKEQKTAAFLALNPKGQVPTFKDDNGIQTDSLDIMLYLEERYPSPSLFLSHKKQDVLSWIDRSSGPMREVSHNLYWQLIEPPAQGADQREVARLKHLAYELLDEMEASLKQHGEYLCGDLSAADLSVFAWVYGFKRFNLPESWENYPLLLGWYQRLEQRPSVGASFNKEGKPFKG